MQNQKVEYVAMVSSSLRQLVPSVGFGGGIDLEVVIAVKSDDKHYPQNFSMQWDTPKTSNGGCYARIFAGEGQGNLFSHYGPDIKFGDLNEYKHALRAFERISKRLHEFYETRGNPIDAAAAMGEWLEASGVKTVWFRPDDFRGSNGWLNEGDWETCNIGGFVSRVRRILYVVPAKTEVAELSETA